MISILLQVLPGSKSVSRSITFDVKQYAQIFDIQRNNAEKIKIIQEQKLSNELISIFNFYYYHSLKMTIIKSFRCCVSPHRECWSQSKKWLIGKFVIGDCHACINELQQMASTSNQIKLFPVTPTHHSINSSSKGLDLPSKNKQTSVLELGRDCVDRCLEILEWRLKTFLPVVKPVRFELNPQRPLSPLEHQHIANRFPQHFQKTSVSIQSVQGQMKDQSDMKLPDAMCEVLVQIQEIKFLLSNIKLLSFPQVVYLLKEMMIGYEVLVDIFGIFEPSDQMVAVNGANQWKLWVNSNFTMNGIPAQNMSEKEFIYKLIVIAEKHCLETTLSKRFFMELKEITYSQECSFVRMLQRIKQFAVDNKAYTVNTVILPKEQSIQEKTLKKQKGYNRIEQLKSSLIDGRFIPKQIWTYKTQKNDPSVCSIGDLDASPARKVESMRDKDNSYSNDNQLSTAWKTHSQLHDYLTPREKNNSNAIHLYSPQVLGETQRSPVLQNKQAISPRLSFTISNSLIERRRRSDQVKCTAKFQTVKQALTERNSTKEMDENQYQLKRQMASKNLNQVDCTQSKQIDLMNSCNKSPSTELKESQAEKCSMAYKKLKKNDFQACGKTRNNHSGFVNISIPIYHHSNNKNLSISYQFKTQNEQKEKDRQQGSDPPISQQWKNTISGLFSDTATVRELKTSIKIKTPKDKKQVRKFSTDVNLEILSKMGRQANDSFDEDDEQDKQYLQMEQLKLTEQSLIFKNETILKDEEQDEILRKPSSNSYTKPKIVINDPPKYKWNVCI